MYRYVVDRSYGAGLNLVFVHICLHDLHFLVTIALDKEVLMTDDCSREITSKTRDLFLDIGLLQTLDDALVSTFPGWFCRHDNELYEDAMRAFALSMDRDRVEKALGESHPALSRIPSAVGSLDQLEGPLVRLPKDIVWRPQLYAENPVTHHPGSVQFNGSSSHVGHVHRSKIVDNGPKDIPVINAHLCIREPSVKMIPIVAL